MVGGGGGYGLFQKCVYVGRGFVAKNSVGHAFGSLGHLTMLDHSPQHTLVTADNHHTAPHRKKTVICSSSFFMIAMSPHVFT